MLTILRRSRPDPGNERQKLQAEAQPGERRFPGSRPSRGRIDRNVCGISSFSHTAAISPDLPLSVVRQVVHDYSAPLAHFPGPVEKVILGRSVAAGSEDRDLSSVGSA